MVLHIDTDRMEALGLTDREMWLYLTLSILSARRPWKGTDEELAAKCKNNLSRATINRLKTSLIQRGLLTDGEDGISPAQNEQNSAQNEHEPAQNEQNSKEKEKNQKKIEKKEIKKSTNVCVNACEERHTTASPDLIKDLFFMNTTTIGNVMQKMDGVKDNLKDLPQPIPANTGYYKIIALEFGYLRPKEFVDNMYLHYNAHGWPPNGNKLDLMRYWMKRYKKLKNARQPNMNENERIVLRTFIDHVEERLIVRLLTVLRGFEVTDEAVRFYVDVKAKDKFYEWLKAIDAPKILEVYHRELKVKGVNLEE